jgi:hypothetical protein
MKLLPLISMILLSGCASKTNRLPEPHFVLHGYVTNNGFIQVIDTKSGNSLAVKSNVLYAEDEEALVEDLKNR